MEAPACRRRRAPPALAPAARETANPARAPISVSSTTALMECAAIPAATADVSPATCPRASASAPCLGRRTGGALPVPRMSAAEPHPAVRRAVQVTTSALRATTVMELPAFRRRAMGRVAVPPASAPPAIASMGPAATRRVGHADPAQLAPALRLPRGQAEVPRAPRTCATGLWRAARRAAVVTVSAYRVTTAIPPAFRRRAMGRVAALPPSARPAIASTGPAATRRVGHADPAQQGIVVLLARAQPGVPRAHRMSAVVQSPAQQAVPATRSV